MSGPLQAGGLWRAQEGALESGVPLLLAGGAWVTAWYVFGRPTAGRPLTPMELGALLGAAAALTGWATARQLYLLGRRRPWPALGWALLTCAMSLGTVVPLAKIHFQSVCSGELGGAVTLADLPGEGARAVCQVGGVEGNPYLRGALIAPAWSGDLSVGLGLWTAALAALGALGQRDRKLRPTAMPRKMSELLRLSPAAGGASSVLGVGPEGRVVACANPTLWGEPCGQLYSSKKVFLPGEWCVRCQQAFSPCTSELDLTVISLYTADLDVLNGLERLDTVSWDQGQPMPADPRLSGQERWVVLGRLRVPDVLSVAQVLSLVHDQIPAWIEGRPELTEAGKLAGQRMSRVAAWLLSGRIHHRLGFARPTRAARYGVGTQRLRDLVPDAGEGLTLQLDIGLLPLELRLAFRYRFLDESRPEVVQNSRLDVWVPVGPPPGTGAQGVWVARVEGEALRAWLATDRVQPDVRGVPSPIPYLPHTPGEPASSKSFDELDLVRRPLSTDDGEPVDIGAAGTSIAEWGWMEWEQIELLRQESLVLVARGGAS